MRCMKNDDKKRCKMAMEKQNGQGRDAFPARFSIVVSGTDSAGSAGSADSAGIASSSRCALGYPSIPAACKMPDRQRMDSAMR